MDPMGDGTRATIGAKMVRKIAEALKAVSVALIQEIRNLANRKEANHLGGWRMQQDGGWHSKQQ